VELLTPEHGRTVLTDKSTYDNCFLFDVVTNPVKYAPFKNNVKAILEGIHKRRGTMHRHTLGTAVYTELRPLIEAASRAHGYTASSMAADEIQYWLWPRTESSDEEVFCSSKINWSQKLRECIPAFHDALDLTLGVIAEMAEPFINFTKSSPLTLPVEFPNPKEAVTDADVTRFFNMLAWRLWADQEITLRRVCNPYGGDWPLPSHYLFYSQYTSEHFGAGIMNYKVPIPGGPGPSSHGGASAMASATKDIEVVIVRPNIEHYMMGIILGQGGESLGSTFWGQVRSPPFFARWHFLRDADELVWAGRRSCRATTTRCTGSGGCRTSTTSGRSW
jgi:hypothetical protein